jgi:hypothetical protein
MIDKKKRSPHPTSSSGNRKKSIVVDRYFANAGILDK